MDFEKVEAYFRQHWTAALLTGLVVAPATWKVAVDIHNERITLLESREMDRKEELDKLQTQVSELRDRVQTLTEASQRSLQFRSTRVDFSSLYTPTPDVTLVANTGQ